MDVSDVVVVGAGPAGCWTARTLARLGARVTIVDGSHPREKPCGGGVTGRALALVGHAIEQPTPRCQIRSARFVDTGRRASATVSLPEGSLDVASRTDFDGALLQAARAAGASVITARVRDVTQDNGSFIVRTSLTSIRARRLIGADGANSLVRRRLAQPFARADLSVATGFFVHGISSSEIVLELLADPAGYIWSFPRPTHLAVGICTQADASITVAALQRRARDWIDAMGFAGARLTPYSWPIPSLTARAFDTLVTSGPNWCLVGDAAGLVDPITREGIYFALRSGGWAAEAMASSRAASTRGYHERVRDEIVSDLAVAARYKAGFFKPRFTQLIVDALAESPPVREVMAGLIAGTQPYRRLKWALAKTAEVGLAWRLLRAKWYN